MFQAVAISSEILKFPFLNYLSSICYTQVFNCAFKESNRGFYKMSTVNLPKNIFNLEKNDYHEPRILLGGESALMDTIHNHFPEVYEIYKRLRKLDWDELEFDFSSCLTDFETCDKSTYDMMLKTLIWQWEADSIAARKFIMIIGSIVTDSRVWAAESRVNENEAVHAMTYSEIIRNSFLNPDDVLEEVNQVSEAHARMKAVSEVLDAAFTMANEYNLGQRENDQELHDIAFLFYVAVYIFERIQFMASFAVTFAICKTGLFQPIGHAVKKIAQDEFEIHVQMRQSIIRSTLAFPEGKQSYVNTKSKIVELFVEVIRSEIEWIDYLFSEGRSLAGVNETKLFEWVLFNAHAVKAFLGITDDELADYAREYKEFTGEDLVFPHTNPLPYMEEYLDISAAQSSPQEEKSKSDYQVNLMDSKGEDESFDVDF